MTKIWKQLKRSVNSRMDKYITVYLLNRILCTPMRRNKVQHHAECWEVSQNLMMSEKRPDQENTSIYHLIPFFGSSNMQ